MPKTILIVEDHPDALEYFEEVLKEEGYEVLTADNGRIGLEMAQNQEIDGLVLDIELPELNGRQIHQALRKQTRYKKLPILFISAGHGETVDDLVDQKHTFYMKKAIDVPALVALLRRTVGV